MMNQSERIPLHRGDMLELVFQGLGGQTYIQRAEVEEMIGEGASCLSYIVRLHTSESSSTRMIMKEFYPCDTELEPGIRREGGRLQVAEETKKERAYIEKLETFHRSFDLQNRLADSEAMEVMVRPYHIAQCGDAYYILSDMHLGMILSRARDLSLEEKLWIIYRTAEAVSLLNEQGYLYMDLNPNNILWIPSQQAVKLFDVDSIIPFRNLDDVHGIRVTRPYTPPELEELEEWFEINKSAFLRPSWDVYCIGLIAFELLTGSFPTEIQRQESCAGTDVPEMILEKNSGCEFETAEQIHQILTRALSRSFRVRYSSAQELCRDVNRVKKRLDAQEFISKKEYAQANYTMQSYYILDQWPLYEYALEEDGKRVLDVALAGSHEMREAFFKAVFSCVHMLDTTLRIRLYGEDAGVFLRRMEEENPMLAQTIRVFHNGTITEPRDNPFSEPLAEVYLYEYSTEEMFQDDGEVFREMSSPYVLLLWEEGELRRRAVNALPQGTAAPRISTRKKCSWYDEELIRTDLMRRALNVHTLYYRGTHERASKKEIRESFESDIYNVESSLRSALSVRYKLGSIGIGREEDHPAETFYQAALTEGGEARERFEKLTALEHKSWCAHLIINGWSLPEESEIEEYAFTGDNDFKDKKRRLHPCLVESRPGCGLDDLERKDWEKQKLNRKQKAGLDSLDLVSLQLHKTAKKKAQESREGIEHIFFLLRRRLENYQSEKVREAFRWLETVKERVYAGESNAEVTWKQAFEKVVDTCVREDVHDRTITAQLTEADRMLRVVHEYNAWHDYKKSDEDIIRGIPFILSAGTVGRVIRPCLGEKKDRWKNILSILYLEPDTAVFVPMDGETVDLDFYRGFLRLRGVSTELMLQDLGDVERTETVTVTDVTGMDAWELRELDRYPVVSGCSRIMIRGRKLIGLDDHSVEMYARDIHLTVEETFYLFGAYMESEYKENAILGLSSRYRNIWNAYTGIKAWGWRVLIECLRDLEEKNNYSLNTGVRTVWKKYQTAPLNGQALLSAGLDLVFHRCREEGVLQNYILPSAQDELPAEFTANCEETARILEKLLLLAHREPLRHQFRLRKRDRDESHRPLGRTEYWVQDRTLYVSGIKQRKKLKNYAGRESDEAELIGNALRKLAECGQQGGNNQSILQNLNITEEQGQIRFSFRYATEAVKECLQREGNILEAMIYFTCLQMGIFDDLNINSEFCWNEEDANMIDEHTVNNEIDIIGTKNMKTYFISAKMAFPENEHLMEIKYFADYFGIEGQAILVTSNYRTADSNEDRPLMREERSRLMDVKYINRTVIDEGRLGAVIKQIVEESA